MGIISIRIRCKDHAARNALSPAEHHIACTQCEIIGQDAALSYSSFTGNKHDSQAGKPYSTHGQSQVSMQQELVVN